MKLDYSIPPDQRVEYVNQIIKENSTLSPKELSQLADYIIFSSMSKQERLSKNILTDNRMITINRHETSYQGLADSLEAGEDGLYNLITDNHHSYITPRIQLSEEDLARPEMQALQESIDSIKAAAESAQGKQKYAYKKWLIDLYREQYVIQSTTRRAPSSSNTKNVPPSFQTGQITISNGQITDTSSFSIFNPQHIFAFLSNYEHLRESSLSELDKDAYYLVEEIKNLINQTLPEHTLLRTLLDLKMAGISNQEIQATLFQTYAATHSIEYISVLWKSKIPRLISEQAQKNYLEWYFTFCEYGKWKRCSKCGNIKLAHPLFFSKNKSSKDGYYSICKDCRATHYKEAKQ